MSAGKEMRYGTRGSLKVDLKEGIWKDFETEEGGGVLDLVMRERDLKDHAEAARWLEDNGYLTNDRPTNGSGGLGRIVATFDYHAPDGEFRFQVVKYDPKNFRQRRPDGKGGWIWDLDGVQKIPYRLPELIEDVAQARTIVIVEGEKDVDA